MADLFAITDGAAPAVPFVVVEFPGPPRGKGRPRSSMAGGFIRVYTDAKTVRYERHLAMLARAAMKGRPLVEGPLAVRMFAMMPIAKSWSKRERDAALAGTKFPTSTPDCDNILKMLDAFNGVVWLDDKQVVRSLIVKEYAERPGLIVEIYTLP